MFVLCRENVSGIDRKRHITLTVCAVFILSVLSSCYKPAACPALVDAPQAEPAVHRGIVGTSVENRPIECFVVGQGWDVTFILATIHGDEPAGTPLVRQMAEHLAGHPNLLQGRKVVLLPLANPDGMARNTRLNARGVDLNRNFSATNRTNSTLHGLVGLSEPEARIIEQLIRQYAPDRIISIHQLTDTGPEALSNRVPKGCIDYDGPAKALANRMAEYCDLPVEKLGVRSGSLGSYAGLTLGIPIITLELPRYAHRLDSELLWQRYGQMLIAAVTYPARPE